MGETLRLVLLGPPGAGKGTQGRAVCEQAKIPHVSTGDLLRQSVADQTPLGQKAARYIAKGDLVPDTLVLEMIGRRLFESDCVNGFVLDGFPRTLPQAEGLKELLESTNCPLDYVLFIHVPRQTTLERLAGRRTCKECGSLYHRELNPPSKPDICDRCQGELVQREDDREETIAARLDGHEQQTASLIQYYRDRGLLREIDGVGDFEIIKSRVFETLGIKPR